MNFRRVLADFRLFRREYLRNRIGLFFALIFPVVLMLLFGAILGAGSNGPVTVYLQNQDSGAASSQFIQALNSTGAMNIELAPANANFTQYLLSHSSAVGILVPKNFTQDYLIGQRVNVTVYRNPADTTTLTIIGLTSGVINTFNLGRANATAVVGLDTSNIVTTSTKYIDYLVPGLIGFSLASPMFNVINLSSEYKKVKLFKRLSLTPLTKGEWLASKILWYTLLGFASFALMIYIGIYWMGAQISVSTWVVPFLVLGVFFFASFGMLVGTLARSVESAGVLGNIILFPMMFLSGTFFPVTEMPSYLQAVAHVLPLYYVIDGLNNVMIYKNLGQAMLDALLIAALSVIVFSLAAHFFKWRDE